MQEGTVKFFNSEKKFGFIAPVNSKKDVFVHYSGLIYEIRENDKVAFEVEEGKKGPHAVNIERID
ncbi:MAG: cold-shock protein [Bacteroidota bacterium]